MKTIPLLIYGAGGNGREVAWFAQSSFCGGQRFEPVAFIDDAKELAGSHVDKLPVYSFEQARSAFPGVHVAISPGSPIVRQRLHQRASEAEFRIASFLHSSVLAAPCLTVGEGTIVAPGSVITVNVSLGKGVQVNVQCSISHDCCLDDFATLAPGVHLLGNVYLGKRVFIGAGAVVRQGASGRPLEIGDDAVIGAGACVTRNVPSGVTVVGVPARPLESSVVGGRA